MNDGILRPLPAVLLVAALAGAAAIARSSDTAQPVSKPAAKTTRPAAAAASVPDSALGLVRASVFSVPVPPRFAANAGAPGEAPRLPRPFPGSPPRVPHVVDDFLPITRSDNECIECHDASRAPESGAVALPASHYRDLRNDPATERRTVAGARYVCVSCHVPTTDAKPLVGNRFVPAAGR